MNSLTYVGNRSMIAEIVDETIVTTLAPRLPAGFNGTVWFPLQKISN
jgi:hypothetical protein